MAKTANFQEAITCFKEVCKEVASDYKCGWYNYFQYVSEISKAYKEFVYPYIKDGQDAEMCVYADTVFENAVDFHFEED